MDIKMGKGIFSKYTDDYFDKNTKELIKDCQLLVELVKKGEFEWDTSKTDSLLWDIRRRIKKVDI